MTSSKDVLARLAIEVERARIRLVEEYAQKEAGQ